MLFCFVCREAAATCPKKLYEHLKHNHGIHEQYDRYICCQGQCSRMFANKYSFGRHIEKEHSNDIELEVQNSSGLSVGNSGHDLTNTFTFDDEAEPCPKVPKVEKAKLDITELAAHFICEAKSNISTLSNIQSVVSACKNMFEVIMDDLVEDLSAVKDDKLPEKWNTIFDKLNRYKNPFSGLETDYSQVAYLERIGVYVRPQTYTVGSRQSFKTDKDGFTKPVREPVTAQYVPIRNSIIALNAKTDIIAKVISMPTRSEGGYYRSYFDGSQWQSHPLCNDEVIVIRLYGDDFEPANPLGSRKTLYKIGTIYYQFENLPPHLLSRTDNMFLALCYYTDDVKTFGWKSVLQPLISELRNLEVDGLKLEVAGNVHKFKVVISAITGDNLFLNGILGYVESFTASYPCRQCCLNRADFQTAIIENPGKLRNRLSYDAAVSNICPSETGIKQVCALNELKYFHAVDNPIQDVMHDLFEGVCAYDLPLICSALIGKRYFSLSDLNHALQIFKYESGDRCSKPPIIVSLQVEMLTFDASQMWCLTRVLSLAVGDRVPEDDTVWQLYICLRHILDLIMAPSVTEKDLQALNVLISEYLELRSTNFPGDHLRNKHHHLTHYPGLIRRIGPLHRFSCMRFEAKHQRSKRILHACGNFKNVPKTCAARHQDFIAFSMLKQSFAMRSDLVIGNGDVITLSMLDNGLQIDECMGHVGMKFEVYCADWVEFRGTKYQPGMCLLANIDASENVPVFMTVDHILVHDQGTHIWFCGPLFKTQYFSSHYHAWIVAQSVPQQLLCLDPMKLSYFLPVNVKKSLDSDNIFMCAVRHRI